MTQSIEPSLPLALAGEGAAVPLVGTIGGQRGAHPLAERGLIPGVGLKVLRDNGGTLLIAVGDARLVLSAGIAHTILVAASTRSDL